MNGDIGSNTFLDALVKAIEKAGAYNTHDQVPPAAILWPDSRRDWEPILHLLSRKMPVFSLGEYSPKENRGPAYWLRCIIGKTISHDGLPAGDVPVIYLPGYSREDVRAVETSPREIQPLAELQYRGVIWSQRGGGDWTILAFLKSPYGGLEIPVGEDAETLSALRRSLEKLAGERVAALRHEAPIRAPFLNGLLQPDDVKSVLRWLNDPGMYREECTEEEWGAFAAVCNDRYGFHPQEESPKAVAENLSRRDGQWNEVWSRFTETPATYPQISNLLRQTKPESTISLFPGPDSWSETWPQDNELAEQSLREKLRGIGNLDLPSARQAIKDLEGTHGERRSWVWSTLGYSPLAKCLEHLATMTELATRTRNGNTIEEAVQSYTDTGWMVDLAVLDALSCIEKPEDLEAVRAAVRTIYRPWLEETVRNFQEGVLNSNGGPYESSQPPDVTEGTCLLFSDGLRFDIAKRLSGLLNARGVEASVFAGLSALPSVTSTAKPAILPAASALQGGDGLDPIVITTGQKVDARVLRKVMADQGFQILRTEDLGDTSGRAWMELGNIDSHGHQSGWEIAHLVGRELEVLGERIVSLLKHGWQKVVLVTDHGWIFMPGGLPKSELHVHLTELRKGRCARLKDGSHTSHLVVPWMWDPDVRIAVAPGICCFEAGKEYEHGGLSPQECVIPFVVSTMTTPSVTPKIDTVIWSGLGLPHCDSRTRRWSLRRYTNQERGLIDFLGKGRETTWR